MPQRPLLFSQAFCCPIGAWDFLLRGARNRVSRPLPPSIYHSDTSLPLRYRGSGRLCWEAFVTGEHSRGRPDRKVKGPSHDFADWNGAGLAACAEKAALQCRSSWFSPPIPTAACKYWMMEGEGSHGASVGATDAGFSSVSTGLVSQDQINQMMRVPLQEIQKQGLIPTAPAQTKKEGKVIAQKRHHSPSPDSLSETGYTPSSDEDVTRGHKMYKRKAQRRAKTEKKSSRHGSGRRRRGS